MTNEYDRVKWQMNMLVCKINLNIWDYKLTNKNNCVYLSRVCLHLAYKTPLNESNIYKWNFLWPLTSMILWSISNKLWASKVWVVYIIVWFLMYKKICNV